ncbi:bis(5'-nucleosyl)-tetraphosphatase PrpE [asymmetrical]-like [Patiria miniata]|uniref:Calcineurin-like phosphoesterase domain-containing protein n=1 Tax=Patiria miniata TaxID=46514 RepID=A0A914A6R5_PATMI|nr:bis(5'-nucleosyl)-tetraphosphatase PrpE [asymmetrical]-like [Patiria miniata]
MASFRFDMFDDIPTKFGPDSVLRHPSPRVPHVVLDHEFIGDKQVFVIGDVHGCFDELQELLQKVEIGTGNSNIITIFVGDLINKGPKNREVLALVRRLGAYSVRGNHDQKCLAQMALLREGKTVSRKYQWLRILTDEDYRQLMELPYSISLPSLQSIVVHACLVPGIPITSQDPVHLMIMRNLVKQNFRTEGTSTGRDTQPLYRPSQSPTAGEPWASLWPGPDHVYFGHDAVRGLQRYEYATGLDTGCVYGRRLTGAFLTGEKQIVQFHAKKTYCEPDGPLIAD